MKPHAHVRLRVSWKKPSELWPCATMMNDPPEDESMETDEQPPGVEVVTPMVGRREGLTPPARQWKEESMGGADKSPRTSASRTYTIVSGRSVGNLEATANSFAHVVAEKCVQEGSTLME